MRVMSFHYGWDILDKSSEVTEPRVLIVWKA